VSLTLHSSADVSPTESPHWRSGLPGFAACALLLGEYLFTTYSLDFWQFAERSDWLALLGNAGSVGAIALAVVTATLLLGGRPLIGDLLHGFEVAAGAERRSVAHRLTFVALHLASVGSFFGLSQALVSSEDLSSHSLWLVALWLSSALSAFLCLLHAVIPLRALAALIGTAGRVLAWGFVLGVVAWAGGLATIRFWDPLGAATLHVVAATLRLVSYDLVVDPSTAALSFEGFGVVIAPACSGYEGIGLLTILTTTYLWASRDSLRFPRVLAILPVGIGLVWLANAMRIAALMVIGARWSPEVALGSFHSKAGWVLFCGIALGLVALSQRASFLSRRTHAQAGGTNPTAAYLTPLLALVAVYLMNDLIPLHLPLLYPLGVVAGALMLWWHRNQYPFVFTPVLSLEACALGVIAFTVWIALEPAADAAQVEGWQRELAALSLPAAVSLIAFRALGSTLVVPVVEELAFRGYLLRRLVSSDFTTVPFARFSWMSFIGSSAAFGLLHERWLAGIIAGMLFALAQYRRGRLGDAILAHAITNLLITLYAIGWREWSLWS
jgi:exosortase E/protease (VPEID-CTERM system)